MNREKFPLRDFDLRRRHGDDETWEQAAQYETAYQLARIAELLDNMLENGLPLGGRSASHAP